MASAPAEIDLDDPSAVLPMETLHCAVCKKPFQRPILPGRKPDMCRYCNRLGSALRNAAHQFYCRLGKREAMDRRSYAGPCKAPHGA